ncbi:MAG: site-specific integrase [Gammaproteobacteria bacterium]|nr:site-specific integrase [Gammaproteobacteria bacterium]
MSAVKFDKKRQFDATAAEWAAFASSLRHKRHISFHAASHGDTERIETNENVWTMVNGGTTYTLDFGRTDEQMHPILKWLMVKFLSSYSITRCNQAFCLVVLKAWTINDLALPSLYEKMELSRNSKSGYQSNDYSIIKRLTEYLISHGAPGTEIDDLFELEQQVPDLTQRNLGYYDMEVRLSPIEEQFIRTHAAHDVEFIARLSYKELRDFVVLKLCYEVGLRPIQLFRLSKSGFQSVNDQYFSILCPWAKKGKANENQKGTDKLALSPELGRAIQTLLVRQNSHSLQLLQNENGSSWARRYGVQSINNTLARWGAEYPHKTPYDFRHNMAHRMVMAGSSASEIAYMLGHSSLVAAQHYIAASPSISALREKALGRNGTYGAMVALLTGELALPDDWRDKEVLGRIGDELATGIGGCDATDCEYKPVYNCYGCDDFHPFEDGNHNTVLDALRAEALKIIAISDSTRQSGMNPAMTQLEGIMEQVKAVISRCKVCRGCQHEK